MWLKSISSPRSSPPTPWRLNWYYLAQSPNPLTAWLIFPVWPAPSGNYLGAQQPWITKTPLSLGKFRESRDSLPETRTKDQKAKWKLDMDRNSGDHSSSLDDTVQHYHNILSLTPLHPTKKTPLIYCHFPWCFSLTTSIQTNSNALSQSLGF